MQTTHDIRSEFTLAKRLSSAKQSTPILKPYFSNPLLIKSGAIHKHTTHIQCAPIVTINFNSKGPQHLQLALMCGVTEPYLR